MYRLITESLLGLRREGSLLRLAPRLSADWPGFSMHYRFGESVFDIAVSRGPIDSGPADLLQVDGVTQADGVIRLVDDGARHAVTLVLGHPAPDAGRRGA